MEGAGTNTGCLRGPQQPQRDTATYSVPFFNRDVSIWQVAQRNKGGFLSSVSLVLGGVKRFFFLPERWGECVKANNMFPIICLLKTRKFAYVAETARAESLLEKPVPHFPTVSGCSNSINTC